MFLQVRRFGSDVGIFPEIEETIPDERCVYGTGTFMYRAHGKLLFFATHFTAIYALRIYLTAFDAGAATQFGPFSKYQFEES